MDKLLVRFSRKQFSSNGHIHLETWEFRSLLLGSSSCRIRRHSTVGSRITNLPTAVLEVGVYYSDVEGKINQLSDRRRPVNDILVN